MDTAIIVALSTVGGTLMGALLNGWFGRRKLKADAAAVLTQAASDLGASLSKRMNELDNENCAIRDEIKKLRKQITSKNESIANLKRLLSDRDERVAELETRVGELEREVISLRAENDALKQPTGNEHA